VSSSEGPQYRIEPPAITLFHQMLDYLCAKPDPTQRGAGTQIGREAVAAALALRWGSYFAVLADRDQPRWAEVAGRLVQAASAERLARARAEAQRYPDRVLANALVNVAWRNGPVEDVHAGLARGYPLAQRRVFLPDHLGRSLEASLR